MRQPLRAMVLALLGGVILGLVLIVLQVPKLPMLMASEVTFVALFSVLYWKPSIIRDFFGTLLKRVRQ